MVLNYKKYIGYILILIAIILVSYFLGRKDKEIVYNKEFVKITQKQVDSIKATIKPIEKEVIVYKDKVDKLKEKTKQIPIPKECEEIVNYKDSIIHIQDTIIIKQDSIIYLWKEVDKKQTDIINILPKAKDKKRFGIGLQGGYGITEKGNLNPYIGIGASYNLIRL